MNDMGDAQKYLRGTYKNTAPDTENGYALNSSFDAFQNGLEDLCRLWHICCEM